MKRPLAVALVLLCESAAWAGAWTLREGEIYLQGYANALVPTDSYYDNDRNGARTAFGDYGLQTFGIYAEYGATPWLTAMFEMPFSRLTLSGINETYVQPRFRLGARTRLIAEPIVASVQAVLNIPVGFASDPAPHRYGDGRFEGYLSLLLSRSFGPLYLTADLGVNMYAERPEAQFRYGLEVGYSNPYLYVQIGLVGAEALRGAGQTEDPLADVVARSSYLLVNPKVGVRLGGGFTFELRMARTLTGRNFPVFTEVGGALGFSWVL